MNDADFANDQAILPPLGQLYGEDAHHEIDLAAMLEVAFDPATPAPEGDLIPEASPEEVDLGDFDDDATSQSDAALVEDAKVDGDAWDSADEGEVLDPLSVLDDELDPASAGAGRDLGDLDEGSHDPFADGAGHHDEVGGFGHDDDIHGL